MAGKPAATKAETREVREVREVREGRVSGRCRMLFFFFSVSPCLAIKNIIQ